MPIGYVVGGMLLNNAVGDPLGIGPQQAQAPDYTAAAKATAAGNLEAAKYATVANRANQITPYGSLTWQKGATDYDPWTQTTSFTPEGQKLFDLQKQQDLAYSQAASAGFDKIKGLFENPNIDESKLTAMPTNGGMTSQQAMLSRLQPTIDREQNSLSQRLANQGITLGSDAYNREMNLQGQRENDRYLQAASQGIGMDMAARQQGLQEQYSRMQNPLNMINALRSGSQVQAPQFSNYAQQATTQGPDYSGAAQNQYGASLDAVNAKNANTNAMMGGLFSMGTSAVGKGGMFGG